MILFTVWGKGSCLSGQSLSRERPRGFQPDPERRAPGRARWRGGTPWHLFGTWCRGDGRGHRTCQIEAEVGRSCSQGLLESACTCSRPLLRKAVTTACHTVAVEWPRVPSLRTPRWHRSAMSGILVDADRPQLGISDADRCTASSVLPQATFSASGASFSLGDAVLTRFRTAP